MKKNIEENETIETVEQISEDTNVVNNALVECQAQARDWQDKYMRINADFDNFRKRTTKEQIMWRQQAQAKVLEQLLDVVDNFDRALQKDATSEAQPWLEGFVLIRKSLDKLLQGFGVEAMNNYNAFDPNFHEALVQVDSPDHASGDIVEVVQQGYLINGAVLRPAKVTIAK